MVFGDMIADMETNNKKICIINESFLRGRKINIFFLGFAWQTVTDHRTAMEAGGHSINSSLALPPASQALRK